MKMKGLFGLSEKKSAALAYVGFFVTGLLAFVLADKEDKKLRFHGLQSTIVLGGLVLVRMLLGWILGWIPIIGTIVGGIATAVLLLAWIGLTLLAYSGATFKVPIVGDACWAYVNKEE
jgi:uncharacterized membrane protein